MIIINIDENGMSVRLDVDGAEVYKELEKVFGGEEEQNVQCMDAWSR